ncbi:MAG: ABC transporter ATP-binding protein [Chloroflexi bacterium]|nr:ABC transporter ATP-binding protein [Chloroflexota bacterium]
MEVASVLILIKDIRKVYDLGEMRVEALNSADLAIDNGEFVAIMGPSGSGKSTLMHILGCLDQPTTGTYLLDGTDVGGLTDDQLAAIRNRKVGFVFQQFNLLPRTSALDNVVLPMLYGGEKVDRKKGMAVLDRVGLAERYHHMPNQLSGGQQQRVAIARALATQPSMILADEPTANLDTANGKQVMDIMSRLNQETGVTFIFATHDPRVVSYAHRVVELRDGLILENHVGEAAGH